MYLHGFTFSWTGTSYPSFIVLRLRSKAEAMAAGARAIITFSVEGTSYSVGLDYLPYSTIQTPDEVLYQRSLDDQSQAFAGLVMFDARGFLIDAGGAPTMSSVSFIHSSGSHSHVTIYPTGVLEELTYEY